MQQRSKRPHVWKSGPDPRKHKLYMPYLRQRTQARWRGEGWPDEFTFEQWYTVWEESGQQENRGRSIDSAVMSRLDSSQDWTQDNVVVMTRKQWFERDKHEKQAKR